MLLFSVDQNHEVKFPPGHIMPPAGQAVGSKCPFLAAEMVQKNNRVVREASMELQEDFKEMHLFRTGKQSHGYTCKSIPIQEVSYVNNERSLFWAYTQSLVIFKVHNISVMHTIFKQRKMWIYRLWILLRQTRSSQSHRKTFWSPYLPKRLISWRIICLKVRKLYFLNE